MHAQTLAPLLLLAALVGLANGFQLTNCAAGTNADAEMLGVTISSCPNAEGDRCQFVKGENATLALDFKPTTVFSQANVSIFGKVFGIKLPFPLDGPKDACGNYGFDCPVKVGDHYQLKLTMPVHTSYPSIPVTVRFELKDERENYIVCVEFPVKIVSK